jgi:hypothetical protein
MENTMLRQPQRLRRSADITYKNNPGGVTQGLKQTGDPLPKPPPTVMPSAHTSPPSPTQANITHPSRMEPRSVGAASEPVVPPGAAFPAAKRTEPAAPAPTAGRVLGNAPPPGAGKPSTIAMTHASIKAQSRRYGGY